MGQRFNCRRYLRHTKEEIPIPKNFNEIEVKKKKHGLSFLFNFSVKPSGGVKGKMWSTNKGNDVPE